MHIMSELDANICQQRKNREIVHNLGWLLHNLLRIE